MNPTIVAHMLNEGNYMFSATLIMTSSGQMRSEAAEAFWSIITGTRATAELVASVLYLREYGGAGASAPVRAMRVNCPRRPGRSDCALQELRDLVL